MGEKVLVVDDTLHLRMLVKRYLQRANFEVIEAGDGEEALRCLQLNPDLKLIFLDLMMPKMSGMDFLSRIKDFKKENGIKICALTAKEGGEDVKSCLKSGADDYLVKPVDEMILIDKAKILLDKLDVNEFSSVEFESSGKIELPEGQIDIFIKTMSESSIVFETDIELPLSARILVKSEELQKILLGQGPVIFRVYKTERSGKNFKVWAAFIGLKDREYKQLRAITNKGGSLHE